MCIKIMGVSQTCGLKLSCALHCIPSVASSSSLWPFYYLPLTLLCCTEGLPAAPAARHYVHESNQD